MKNVNVIRHFVIDNNPVPERKATALEPVVEGRHLQISLDFIMPLFDRASHFPSMLRSETE